MTYCTSRPSINIQEKNKTTRGIPGPSEAQVVALAALMASPGMQGRVLRTLVRRLTQPDAVYTGREMETLLLVTVAAIRAGLWQ